MLFDDSEQRIAFFRNRVVRGCSHKTAILRFKRFNAIESPSSPPIATMPMSAMFFGKSETDRKSGSLNSFARAWEFALPLARIPVS